MEQFELGTVLHIVFTRGIGVVGNQVMDEFVFLGHQRTDGKGFIDALDTQGREAQKDIVSDRFVLSLEDGQERDVFI